MKTITTSHEQLAIWAGGAIIAAATNAIIQKTGGLWTSHAVLVIGLAFGVFTASYVLPRAWRDARAIAIVIICALTAGELYNFATTAERIVITREEAQAPLRAQADKRAAAVRDATALAAAQPSSERLTLAKQRLADVSSTAVETQRVRVAREQAKAAQAAVDLEAGNVRCRSECVRKQGVADKAAAALQQALEADAAERSGAIAKAEAELSAALTDAVTRHAANAAEAKAAADALPEPVSATPLAERTGVAPWALDLVLAALLSLGANGLAAALIAYGASALETERALEIERQRQTTVADARTFSEIKDELSVEKLAALRERFLASDAAPAPLSPAPVNVVALFPNGSGFPNSSPNGLPDGRPDGSGPKPGRRATGRKADVLADIKARDANGERFASQEDLRAALAERFGPLAKSTLSEWLGELEAERLIADRTVDGRRKRFG